MARSYSVDLRERVVARVEAGETVLCASSSANWLGLLRPARRGAPV